jgi:uncharacterized membrane protein YdfJ with MMPL/SSD domain
VDGEFRHQEAAREVRLAARALRGVAGIRTVGSPVLSADGRAALLAVAFAGSVGYAQTRVPAVEAALAHARLAAVKTQLIGQAGIYQRYQVQSKRSLQTASLISFPVTLAILLVAFLSVVAALLPLGLAAMCVGVTFGMLYLLSYVVQLSVFVEDTVLVLGLGLSIDFSLFMVTRVRESLARGGATVEQAVTEALRTSGRAIAVSAVTIAAALGGLYVTGLGIFSSLATGAIGAALIAAAAALTLTPAALVLLGDRLDRLSIPVAVNAARSGRFWRGLADFVVRRCVAVVAMLVPILVVLSVPLGGMHITLKTLSVLPSSDPVRVASAGVAALTTLLSVSAALGIMTFCFRSTGDIGYFVPLFLFATIFGLSTDYEVFLLSRVREHHLEGASNTDALKRALIGSSRSITLAGLAMGVVFFSFAVSPLVPFQELGVGMGLAIVLDVTVVRGLLVPATVALLGEANWWRPGRTRPTARGAPKAPYPA